MTAISHCLAVLLPILTYGQAHLQDEEAVGFTVAVEGRVRGVVGCRDVGVDLDLQLGLEAGHEGPMLLHVCAQHHLDHHLP